MAVSSVLSILGLAAPLHAQGDLTPPPFGYATFADQALDGLGAPRPNMKSLTQTDPGQPLPSKDADLPDLNGSLPAYTITEPGHYYLTQSLVGDFPIIILADDVTVDLRGFEMRFMPTGGPGGAAISVGPGPGGPVQRVHVRNGFINGGWDAGVMLGDYSSVRDLNVTGAHTFAISVGGQSTVHNCIVRGMDLDEGSGPMPHAGIFGGFGSVVSHSTAREIWGTGIAVDRSSRIVNCTATCNLGSGFEGMESVTITGCTSFMNLKHGYDLGRGASVTGCTAHENHEVGINTKAGSVLANCTSRQNLMEGYIAEPDVPSELKDHAVPDLSDNASSYLHCSATRNGSDGFLTTVNSTYTHCTADGNGFGEGIGVSLSPGDGFDVVDSCRIVNCMASNNALHGIRAVLDNFIEQNTCHTNGMVGIDLAGPGNTVIKNYAKFNPMGPIFVGGAPLPAPGIGGVAPIVLPSAPAPNPFGNFAF